MCLTAALMRVHIGSHNSICFSQQPLPYCAARDPWDSICHPKSKYVSVLFFCLFVFLSFQVTLVQQPVFRLASRDVSPSSTVTFSCASLQPWKKKKSLITADVRTHRHGNTTQKFPHFDFIQSISALRQEAPVGQMRQDCARSGPG